MGKRETKKRRKYKRSDNMRKEEQKANHFAGEYLGDEREEGTSGETIDDDLREVLNGASGLYVFVCPGNPRRGAHLGRRR